MTNNTVNLGNERSKKSNRAKDWTPKEALQKIIDDIDNDKGDEIEHIMIIKGHSEGCEDFATYTSAGDYRFFQQLGMLNAIEKTMLETND